MSNNDITLSRNVIEMATVAEEFCAFLEKGTNHLQSDFFRTLQGLIPLLYLRGSLLPQIIPEFPEAAEYFVNEEQWECIFYALRKVTRNQDEFWHVINSTSSFSETTRGSISEHLADVYQDIKNFLLLYKRNSYAARENAIALCLENFKLHWGAKLATVLIAIHQIQNNETTSNFEEIDFF